MHQQNRNVIKLYANEARMKPRKCDYLETKMSLKYIVLIKKWIRDSSYFINFNFFEECFF